MVWTFDQNKELWLGRGKDWEWSRFHFLGNIGWVWPCVRPFLVVLQSRADNERGETGWEKRSHTVDHWWMEIWVTFCSCESKWAQLCIKTGPVCSSKGDGERMGGCFSALPTPRTAMFATAGSQQSLQSHLHKCLEIIASLPSAVLRGDGTQKDTFNADMQSRQETLLLTYCSIGWEELANYNLLGPALNHLESKDWLSWLKLRKWQLIYMRLFKPIILLPSILDYSNAYLLAFCYHLLSDQLSSVAPSDSEVAEEIHWGEIT